MVDFTIWLKSGLYAQKGTGQYRACAHIPLIFSCYAHRVNKNHRQAVKRMAMFEAQGNIPYPPIEVDGINLQYARAMLAMSVDAIQK